MSFNIEVEVGSSIRLPTAGKYCDRDIVITGIKKKTTYTNLLDAAGWTKGIYLSSGEERTDANAYTTGYMPVVDKGTIYLKNVTIPDESSHGNRFCLYNEDKSFKGSISLQSSAGQEVEYDSNGNLIRFKFWADGTRYIRLSTWGIDETSIITYNEPIE